MGAKRFSSRRRDYHQRVACGVGKVGPRRPYVEICKARVRKVTMQVLQGCVKRAACRGGFCVSVRSGHFLVCDSSPACRGTW